LLRGRRQQIHASIAATLEGRFPEIVETQPELLARHCSQAGLVEKAVGYWLRAGQQSFARCAMTEAVAQLHKGIGLLSDVPEGALRQEQEIDLQITLGNALLAIKGHSAREPGEAFARARQLCEQLGRAPNLRVLIGQFSCRLARGELEQAERHAKETLCLGEARNDVIWRRAGLNANGATCFYLGKFIDARVYYENALSLWDPMNRASATSPEDPYVSGLTYLFRTLLCLGNIDQARLRRDEALAEARRLTRHTLVFTLCQAWLGDRAIDGVKSAQTMLRSADEVLAITSEQGFPLYFGIGNIMRGWCLGTVGQAAEGIPLILRGLEIWRATGANLMMPSYLMTLAEVYGMAAQPDEGLDRLAEAAELIETTQERWAEAEMHRVRGTLLLSMHEPAAAEDSFQHALAVARRQSARFWELRAALDLARLWRDQGKRTEARDLLAPIYSWFTEGFDTPVLQEARALLDQLA
jgi:predicted ATPase